MEKQVLDIDEIGRKAAAWDALRDRIDRLPPSERADLSLSTARRWMDELSPPAASAGEKIAELRACIAAQLFEDSPHPDYNWAIKDVLAALDARFPPEAAKG